MHRFLLTIIQFVLLIEISKQSHVRQAITTFKTIGKTIKNPMFKTIGNTFKKSVIKTFGNNIKNSAGMFRRNKSTIKNFACGLQEKYLTARYSAGSVAIKSLGEGVIKKFKYIAPLASKVSSQIVQAPVKQNIQKRSAAQMRKTGFGQLTKRSVGQVKGQKVRSLINMIARSKPYIPLLFVGAGLNRITQSNFQESNVNFDLPYDPKIHGGDPFQPEKHQVAPEGSQISYDTNEGERDNRIADGHEPTAPPDMRPDDYSLGEEIVFEHVVGNDHESTQIWMHGLGDSAEGFKPLFDPETNNTPLAESTRVRLLTAPYKQVTLNNKTSMNSWFDIKDLEVRPTSYDIFTVVKVAKYVKEVIREEIERLGGNSKKVYIGGFSQGAAMALHVGLGYDKPLGGVIGLSGFKLMETAHHPCNKDIPVFLSHGTDDTVLPLENVKVSYEYDDWLQKPNVQLFIEPDMAHTIEQEVTRQFAKFFKKINK